MSASYTHPPPPSHLPTQPFTTILLPPPTTADTLNIHEYRPPPVKEPDPKRQNSSNSNSNISLSSNTRSRAHSHSASPNPNGSSPPHRVNTNTPVPPQPAPYVNASATPAVPATFANIMNAYPPQPSVREEPQVHSHPGSREESARRPVRE